MSYAHIDTPSKHQAALPAKVWIDDSGNGTEGHYEAVTVENASTYGWYPVDTSAVRPTETATTRYVATYPLVVDTITLTWDPVAKTQQETDAWNDNTDREAKGVNVGNAVDTLRQWALDAQSTTVNNGNNTTVTQTLVDRLGVFFDRFADLIEYQRIDQ